MVRCEVGRRGHKIEVDADRTGNQHNGVGRVESESKCRSDVVETFAGLDCLDRPQPFESDRAWISEQPRAQPTFAYKSVDRMWLRPSATMLNDPTHNLGQSRVGRKIGIHERECVLVIGADANIESLPLGQRPNVRNFDASALTNHLTMFDDEVDTELVEERDRLAVDHRLGDGLDRIWLREGYRSPVYAPDGCFRGEQIDASGKHTDVVLDENVKRCCVVSGREGHDLPKCAGRRHLDQCGPCAIGFESGTPTERMNYTIGTLQVVSSKRAKLGLPKLAALLG